MWAALARKHALGGEAAADLVDGLPGFDAKCCRDFIVIEARMLRKQAQ